MKYGYRVYIEDDYQGDKYRIHVFYENDRGLHYLFCNKPELRSTKAGERSEPFFEISKTDNFLQALSDSLGEIGIYPGATNKDKIQYEAISDERKEQISYLRGFLERLVFKE